MDSSAFIPFPVRGLVALAALAALAVPAASGAQAATVYDNLASSADGADAVFGYGPLADSFSTGASGASLASVLLSLTSLSDAYTGTLSVVLRGDAAAAPGASLATLGTLPFGGVSTAGFGEYAFTPTTAVALSPGTRYWIELSGSAPNAVQWSWSNDTAAPGVAGEYSASAVFGVVANSSVTGPYQMTVQTAPVPEPSMTALMAVGLAALLAAGSARRGKR